MTDLGKEIPQQHFSPIPVEEVEIILKESFDKKEASPGQHSILDTDWTYFLGEFKRTTGIDEILKGLYQRDDIDILDEGCGSSLTVFQAVEDAELHTKKGSVVRGYGITASLTFLNRGVDSPAIREQILKNVGDNELSRTKLLLDGVQYNKEYGYHRFSQEGNLIRIIKQDLHLLTKVFPGQKFDLIYSSNAYPHLSLPWLVFKQSCDALKNGGVLMIDGIETDGIFDSNGDKVSFTDYQNYLTETNKSYKFHFIPIENNPFYSKVVVEKLGEDELNSGLYLAGRNNSQGESKAVVIFSSQPLRDFSSVEELR